jgi:putative ABC transport system permease protein
MQMRELCQALRIFHREPAFAAAAVITLALGIGANTALFAIVEAALLRPLPFERAEDLVVLRHRDVQTGLTKPDVALGDFMDLRARQRSLDSLAGFGGFQATFVGGHEAVRLQGASVTPDALQALRLQPALGRLLQNDDAREGAAPVAVVSHEFWRTQLGSDPQAIARSIQLGPTRTMVVGVLPAGFRFPGMPATDLIVPQPLPGAVPAQRKSGWMYAIGRLRAGQTLDQAAAEMATLSRQFEAEFPEQNKGTRYEALPLRESLVGDTRKPLLLLLGAVGFVLLMACANVGNLMLARALGRERELAVRLALGASPRRLAMHVLTEAFCLAVAGGTLAVVVAWNAAPILAALVPNAAVVPGLETAGVNLRVLLFALGTSVLATMIFGGVACLGLVRRDTGALRERQGTLTPRATLAASGLVATQVALAVVLLAGAGLTLQSFSNLLAVNPGFTPAGVLTLQLSLPEGRYDADDARRAFYSQAFEAIEALPDVDTVGAAMVTPLTGNNWSAPLQRVDRRLAAGERPPEVGWQMASRGYFRALQIPLRSGRLFEPRDATGPTVVIISRAAADRHFPGEQALGHRVGLGDMEAEIVGVVGDIRRASLTDEPRADLYFPFERVMSPQTTLFIRASGDPTSIVPSVRAAVRGLEPQAVIDETRTLAAIAEESAAVTRLATRLLGGFAAIALLLAALGVYGVMAYRVRRRTRELGTRLALGATPVGIVWLVLRQAGTVVGIGLAAGAVAAVGFARTLSSVLFQVAPWDPGVLASTAALLAAVSLAASYLPARRASRVNPVTVLSSE